MKSERKLTARELLEVIPDVFVNHWERENLGGEAIVDIVEEYDALVNLFDDGGREQLCFGMTAIIGALFFYVVIMWTQSMLIALLVMFGIFALGISLNVYLEKRTNKKEVKKEKLAISIDRFCREAQVIFDAHRAQCPVWINISTFRSILVISASTLLFAEQKYLATDGADLSKRLDKVAASHAIDQAKEGFELLWKSFISLGFLPPAADESSYKKAIFAEA